MTSPLFDPALAPGEKIALIGERRAWRYAELRECVREEMERLSRLGVGAGTRVALRAAPGERATILAHALWALRATFVPLNLRWTEVEIGDVLSRIGPALSLSCEADEAWDAQEIRGDARVECEEPVQLILFTSGTTGRSKGALLTFRAVEAGARAAARLLNFSGAERWLCCLPLYHIAGLSILYRSAFTGASVLLHERFDPAAVNRALDEEITTISLVPTQLQALLEERRDRPFAPALECILLGGAKAPQGFLERALAMRAPLAPTFGMTETASQVCTLPPREFLKLRAIPEAGLFLPSLPGVETRVVDERGVVVADGEVGEIALRGGSLLSGYLGDPQASIAALRDGWLHTGDMGIRDGRGALQVLERRSDLIVSGGENVYPAEIEAALRAHPLVSDAAVVGISDARWGQRVAAAVTLEGKVRPSELERFLRDRLAGYKIPRVWRIVDALPRTSTGKLRRAEVRAFFEKRNEKPDSAVA